MQIFRKKVSNAAISAVVGFPTSNVEYYMVVMSCWPVVYSELTKITLNVNVNSISYEEISQSL